MSEQIDPIKRGPHDDWWHLDNLTGGSSGDRTESDRRLDGLELHSYAGWVPPEVSDDQEVERPRVGLASGEVAVFATFAEGTFDVPLDN